MAAGQIIQSAGDPPTRIQTNAGAITDTTTPILSPTTPFKILLRRIGGSSDGKSNSNPLRFLHAQLSSVSFNEAGHTSSVRKIDAGLKCGAKSV